VANLYVFLALSLSLSLAACASLVLFVRSEPRNGDVEATPEVMRMLKNERASLSLRSWPRAARWCSIVSASVPRMKGISLEADQERGGYSFTVTATHAGRYEGLEVEAEFADALQLFRKVVSVRPRGFVVEVLPLSLLLPPSPIVVSATAWGELPAGLRGSGQEFYGQEEYSHFTESKDILWKRVSREPEPRIIARVREANVPRFLRVALVESMAGDKTAWMDAASETLGRVGRSLLSLGMGIEVTFFTREGESTLVASTLEELAELVIQVWRVQAIPEALGDSAAAADLLVAGSGAFANRALFDLSERKPTLVVPEGGSFAVGGWAELVSDETDIESFISGVIVR